MALSLKLRKRDKDAQKGAKPAIVWAWNSERGDFDACQAKRTAPNEYEITGVPSEASDHTIGDVVACELSDGELVVQRRLYASRLM